MEQDKGDKMTATSTSAGSVTRQHVGGGELTPLKKFQRTSEFWIRASSIYAGYKATQAKSLMLKIAGWSDERIEKEVWEKQHERAAEQMYSVCVDLRGFYLKVLHLIIYES